MTFEEIILKLTHQYVNGLMTADEYRSEVLTASLDRMWEINNPEIAKTREPLRG